MHILNIFLLLLRDESSDVRANLFKQLNYITNVVGVETLQLSIVPAMKELSSNKNWRVRKNSLELLEKLAREIVHIPLLYHN